MTPDRRLNTNTPTVSVVTGVYNSTKYLPFYFQMLEAQTFADFEVILVDDGSTDHTCAMIEDQIKKDPRFRLVRKKPEGFPSRSRAVGLSEARGKYVAFVDHDDFWAPQKLEFQMYVLETVKNVSILHTDRVVWDQPQPPKEIFKFLGSAASAPLRQQLPEQVIYKGLQIIFSSFIAPVELVRKVGFHPDMKGVDDLYLFVRLAQMGLIYRIDLPLTYYYAHGNNLSHSKNIFVDGFYKVYEL